MQQLTISYISDFCAEFIDIIMEAQSNAQKRTEAFTMTMQMTVGFFVGGVTSSIMISIMAATVSVMATIYYTITMMWYSSSFAMEMNAIVVGPINAAFQESFLATYYSAGYYIYWNPSKYSCFNSTKVEITAMVKSFHADLKQANADRKKKIKDDQDAADQEQKDKLKKKKDEGKAKCKNHDSSSGSGSPEERVTEEEKPCYIQHYSNATLQQEIVEIGKDHNKKCKKAVDDAHDAHKTKVKEMTETFVITLKAKLKTVVACTKCTSGCPP